MAQNPVVIVAILLAVTMVVFWKTMIKFMIMVAATGVIVFVAYGAITMWQSTHH